MIGTKTGRNRRRAVVALLMGAGLAVAGCEDSRPPSASPAPSPADATPVPRIPQAKWKMKTSPVGRVGKLSKKQKRRHKTQREHVKSVVREVYAALFLEPDSVRQVVSDRFSRRAGRALLRAGPGFRPGAERVRTVRRTANIGLQAHTASAAAAKIFVKARARGSDSVVRVRHRATMWMQRIDGEWKVIGFEVDQERVG